MVIHRPGAFYIGMFIKAVVITTGLGGVLPVLFYRRYNWHVHPFSDKNIESADVQFYIFTCLICLSVVSLDNCEGRGKNKY